MKLTPLRASVIALAFFMAPASAFAASAGASGTMVVAQADEAGQGSKRAEAVRKFLAGGRNLAKLPDDRLQQRLKRALALQGSANLPADLAAQLQQEVAEINAEVARRQSAGASTKAAPAETAAKKNDQKTAETGAPADTGDVQAFIASAKPAAELQDKPLRAQVRQAAQLSKTAGLSNDQRQKLRQIMRDGRAEIAKRGNAGGDANDSADTGTAAGKVAQAGDAPANIAGFLQAVKPAADLNDKDLRNQVRQAAQLSKTDGLSKDARQQLREVMREGRTELVKRGKGETQAGTGSGDNADNAEKPDDTAQTDTGDAKADPQSEQTARAIIDDKDDPSKLPDAALRKRLDNMRNLLAANNLSPATKKALRQKLAAERLILRNRIGKGTTINGDNNTVNNTTNNTTVVINTTVINRVINDRRPSRDLNDDDLRIRINVYNSIIADSRYTERERNEWRQAIVRDRVLLRDRLLDQRRRRQQDLTVGVSTGKFNLQLGLNFQPDRPLPPRAIFAAEARDEELEEVLAAPPRRAIDRRYSVEEVEADADLRDAVARIEIDTVRFGFGEGFLREEEIENLDRIAEIMEKILAAHPGEVFMIEGHTDAVGSDAANLQLSRERAKAVKEALATYYVIPEQNLKTVGFGERYLKIPTPEAEPENRRVSVARITALVGALSN